MTVTVSESAPPEPRKKHAALDWWERLKHPKSGSPGTLAQLRRSRSTAEAMRIREALDLARRMGAVPRDAPAPDWKVRAALDLARVLAHVKEHDPARHPMRAAGWKSFAGERKESDLRAEERHPLSEARFRRLLQTGDGEEKVAAFVRLIALLDGTANVADLARDFIDWSHPTRGDRLRERWAFLYYGASNAAPALPEDDSQTEDDG